MATQPLSDELAREAADAFRAAGGEKTRAAALLGIHVNTYRNRLKHAAERGMLDFAPVMPGFVVKSVASKVGDAWVRQGKEPGEEFATPEGHIVKGVSALVDADGRVVQQWIKTRNDQTAAVNLDALKAVFESYAGAAPLPPPPVVSDADLLTVYPIADLHLGMFSWAKETGADYDLKVASDLLMQSMATLVARSASAETALVLDLGDYFHSDNSRNQTARSGNPLDVDTRHRKVVQVGFELVIRCIELALQKHSRVIYRKLPGNHDDETSGMLAIAVAAHFRNAERVTVDLDPGRFFVHQHGRCMIVATHGDMLRMGDLAGFAAAQWPKCWGDTTYRYGYTGHVHNERALNTSTARGMRLESFNTIAAKDAWHAAEGYQSPRNMVSITLHKTRGEADRLTVPV